MKNHYLNKVLTQLENTSNAVQTNFGNLSDQQLNWKPHPKTWSVGQCLDHLIVTNNTYFQKLKALSEGSFQPNFFEKKAWLLDFWGGMVIKSTLPEPTMKGKSPGVFQPTQSDVPDSIVNDFVEHNAALAELLKQLDGLDHNEVVISSPAGKFVTYTLKTACTVIGNHEQRHYNQALRVMELEAFPK